MSYLLLSDNEELRDGFLNLEIPQDIAKLLDVDYKKLIYHLYIAPRSEQYAKFNVSKRTGGVRKISSPVTALKIIQQKLNQVLQSVYQTKPSVHGFVPEKSIVTNARVHTRQRYVFNLDLIDFFPTINFGRVRGMFMAVPYDRNPKVATVLAQICCHNNELPQGAPTSPVISNMICSKMDSQLQRLAKKHRCIYTRYADDITFSTSMPTLPSALARFNSFGQIEVGDELEQIIKENWFSVNPNKVRLQRRHQRQEVTGLVVNRFPNVKRKYVKQIRAMLHAWKTFGLDAAEKEFFRRYDKKHRSSWKEGPSFKLVVKGKIEFLGMVRGKNDPAYLKYRSQLRQMAPELVEEPESPIRTLLDKYDSLCTSSDAQRRGYLLQDLLDQTFAFFNLSVVSSFVRNEGAEQIDGAFKLDGWHYIVECRWRKKLADIRELDGLYGQVTRSGKQTMGLFLSINGWSENAPQLLKQNSQKSVVLMNGEDLRGVLTGEANFIDFIREKLTKLNIKGEPHYGVVDFINEKGS